MQRTVAQITWYHNLALTGKGRMPSGKLATRQKTQTLSGQLPGDVKGQPLSGFSPAEPGKGSVKF